MISFIIPGEPKSKLRHRSTKSGKMYNPKQNLHYETWVKECYWIKNKQKSLKGQIKACIKAYFKIPKSISKKKKKLMIAEEIRPTKKPDTDNIAKIVLDSLNTLAFDDDKQVVELNVEKYYSDNPRVEVELYEVNRE